VTERERQYDRALRKARENRQRKDRPNMFGEGGEEKDEKKK